MRKIKRAIVHALLEAKGYKQVNKKKNGKSFFARNWQAIYEQYEQASSEN